MDALSKYEETIKQTKEFVLVNRDAVEHMKGIPSESVDLVLTDPPYGLNIHEMAMGLGGETDGDLTTSGIKYEDSEEYAKGLLKELAVQSYRLTKPNGHFYSFCAPSHFWWFLQELRFAGWIVRERPIVWIKRETGQNNQPSYWPSSAYEFIIFARKMDSRLVLEGRADWIQTDPVLPSVKVHQAEKPIPLLKELIARTCMPGSYVYDPFMGSGAVIEAACELKMLAIGCELSVESYATTLARMTKWMEKAK
jgi:DNA modification methylase